MKRVIFHIDVNSAFLSWEATYRVKQGMKDIRFIPSAIGGDREKRSGVILAKSISAKKYGVKTGEPVSMALRKCPELVLFRPNFSLYQEYSKAFMDICAEYTPVLEKFSIDECFLDMTGMEKIYPDILVTANEIKNRIKNELGFTVNVGVGSNKLLAKMASDFEKPDKVHTLFDNEISEKLWPLPIRELFSVGASTAQKLEHSCIKTIGDLAHLDVSMAKSLLGVKMGEHLHRYANGIDDAPVHESREKAKGYGNSITLEYDVKTFADAYKILLALADSTAARMRADGVKAHCVSVVARDIDFNDRSHQKKIDIATDITSEIFEICRTLLNELWDAKKPLRLLGVSLTDIIEDVDVQLSLFDFDKKDKERTIDKTVDSIRKKFGKDTIVRGGIYKKNIKIGKNDK